MTELWRQGFARIDEVPQTDGLLERAMRGPRLQPLGPDRSRTKKMLVIALALAVGVAGVALAVVALRGTKPRERITPAGYRDAKYGWTIEPPAGFTVTPFDGSDPMFPGEPGVVIANFNVPGPFPLAFSGKEDFPSDGVLLEVKGAGATGPLGGNDSAFPLSLEDAKPAPVPDPRTDYIYFQANGLLYTAFVWLGPDASKSDEDAIAAAVASIEFPPLPNPPSSGAVIYQDRLYVLDRADTFRVGSVTLYDSNQLPTGGEGSSFSGPDRFFLVHAPGGFYGVAGFRMLPDDKTACPIEFDQSAFEFRCPLNGARWDRLGRVIEFPGVPDPKTWDIVILPVGIAHDGHVLVDPFSNVPGTITDYWKS